MSESSFLTINSHFNKFFDFESVIFVTIKKLKKFTHI